MQFTLKVIGNMIMSLEPSGEDQEKFRANFKLISSSFASLPFKIPGFAFHRGIKVMDLDSHENTTACSIKTNIFPFKILRFSVHNSIKEINNGHENKAASCIETFTWTWTGTWTYFQMTKIQHAHINIKIVDFIIKKCFNNNRYAFVQYMVLKYKNS